MSEQGSRGDSAATDAIAKRARARQARDKELVEASREGDRNAFGQLYDSWVDSVYDRAVHAGASAAEAREITEQTFLTAWQNLGRLKQPAAIGAKILQVAQRQATSRVKAGARPAAPGGPLGEAEDRLTRATDAAKAAADSDVAAVLRDASMALDDRTREVLDLHYRQGLTASETAAVVGGDVEGVKETIVKLPTALSVLTRARVLWRGGHPVDDELAQILTDERITSFDAATVRTINRFAKDHDRARARSMIAVAPIDLFAAIPLAAAPAGLKSAVAERLVGEGVPMDGSAFVKRDDRGQVLAPPKPKAREVEPDLRAERERARAEAEAAAAMAAAAVVADAAVQDEAPAAAASLLTVPGADEAEAESAAKGTKVSERFRARKSAAAAPAVAAAAGSSLLEPPAPVSAPPLETPSDAGGNGTSAPLDEPVADLAPAPVTFDEASGTWEPPAYGAGATTTLDDEPSAADLDARAEGEAAALGRPYSRSMDDDDGDADREIPGSSHLDDEGGAGKKKALLVGGAIVAAVVLLGGAAMAMRGGEETTTASGPKPTNPEQTTVVTPTSSEVVTTSTRLVPETTLAPTTASTVAPPTTGAPAPDGGGNPNPGGGGATPTTPAPTVTVSDALKANGSIGMVNSTVAPDYAKSGAPVLSWNATIVSGSVLTITTAGPGPDMAYDNADAPTSGSKAFCPNEYVGTGGQRCTAGSGTYTYTLNVRGADGSSRELGRFSLTVS